MESKSHCPECGHAIDRLESMGESHVVVFPCLHLFTINLGAIMSAARSNPEVLTATPGDGPALGLTLPDRVLRKSEFPVVAHELVERMLEVSDSPSAFILLRQVQEVAKAAEDILKPKVMLAAAGASVEIAGAKIEYRKAPAKWDYKNDAERERLLNDIETMKSLLSAREKFLQALPEPMKDSDGREVLPAVQADSQYTLAVTFAK